ETGAIGSDIRAVAVISRLPSRLYAIIPDAALRKQFINRLHDSLHDARSRLGNAYEQLEKLIEDDLVLRDRLVRDLVNVDNVTFKEYLDGIVFGVKYAGKNESMSKILKAQQFPASYPLKEM